MRFLTPVIMFAAGGYVWWFNATHTDEALGFGFLERVVPSIAGDHDAVGRLTAYIFFAIGALTLVRAIWATIQQRRYDAQLAELSE